MIKKIASVAVYVDDQKKATDFWIKGCGFEVRVNQPMGGNEGTWLEVAPPGAESCLVIYPKSLMPKHAELKPSIVFVVDDIQKTFEHMSSNGVLFIDPPKTMSWGTFARFADHDGNEFLIRS